MINNQILLLHQKQSHEQLVQPMVEAFGENQAHDRLPIFFADHVVDHYILGGPAIPLLAVLALGAMMVFFWVRKEILYWVGNRLLFTR